MSIQIKTGGEENLLWAVGEALQWCRYCGRPVPEVLGVVMTIFPYGRQAGLDRLQKCKARSSIRLTDFHTAVNVAAEGGCIVEGDVETRLAFRDNFLMKAG